MYGAAKVGNIDFLKYLHGRKCLFNRRTTYASAEAGDLKTLKWLIKHGTQPDDLTFTYAAVGGHIEILKFLITTKGCHNRDASRYAAEKGQFETIKYLHSVYPESLGHAVSGAAKGGHLDILKFAFSHGHKLRYPFWSLHLHVWEWLIENNHFKYDIETIQNVAWGGNLESLQYIHSKGFDVRNEDVFEKAVCSKNIEMIQWLHDIKCDEGDPKGVFEAVSDAVAPDRSLPVLKLLVSWGYDLADSDCRLFARCGDLDTLQYQYTHGCPLDKKVISNAAMNGHLHIIIWCRKQGCAWDAKACHAAAHDNHLNVLKWLRGVDRDKCGLESDETEICPWDDDVCLNAILQNYVDVLEFALLNGCEFGPRCLNAAQGSSNADIISCVSRYYEMPE